MLNQKEISAILISTLTLGIIVSLIETWNIFFVTTGLILITILLNIISKKVTSFYLDTETEISLWEFKKFGYKKHHKFTKPIPAGILIPLVVKFFTVGIINWMACLTFEVKGKIYKAAKRHGLYSFSEVTESEMGWIGAAGIITNIFFAFLGYIMGYPLFAKLNITYAFFNIIPISNLDGSKIFFGNKLLWIILAITTSMGVLGMLVIV
jgi:Zn-dependent protease